MPRELRMLTEAELETTQAAYWYEGQRNGLGDEFLAELQTALDQIRREPTSSARLESYSGPDEVRRYRLRRFPYLVIYACQAERTIVLAVSHVRREPFYWLNRLES